MSRRALCAWWGWTRLVACAFLLRVVAGTAAENAASFVLSLVEDEALAHQFPPGGRLAPSEFWTAAPTTQDSAPVLGKHYGPSRLAADFVNSGESDMLGWRPPCDHNATGNLSASCCRVEPLADTQTLVRFLGGLRSSDFPNGTDKTAGDVVVLSSDGEPEVQWDLVFQRLDPFVEAEVRPIIVLDNVPWAFAKPSVDPTASYGNDMGPQNLTQYTIFLHTLLRGIVQRYGSDLARNFWFRVGTEPDTQPGHWNDTVSAYVSLYTAAATAVRAEVPGALVGPANFAADGPSRAESWETVVEPIVQGIVATGAPIDFLAMSCYGRAMMCHKSNTLVVQERSEQLHRQSPSPSPIDRDCEYSPQFAATCGDRLRGLLQLMPTQTGGHVRQADLPLQVMEYGLQENEKGIVNSQPGAWGGAWTLASSVQLAIRGIERVYHWGFGDRSFANGASMCPAPLSPCGLYGSNIWVASATAHLFRGASKAWILGGGKNMSNSSASDQDDGGVSASGIGLTSNRGVCLLISLFDPQKHLNQTRRSSSSTLVSVQFTRPASWGPGGSALPSLMKQYMVLNRSTSVYDRIRAEAALNGTLRDDDDRDVYTLKQMLDGSGLQNIENNADRWFAAQRNMFLLSEPMPANSTADQSTVSCPETTGRNDTLCRVSFSASAPTVIGLCITNGNHSTGERVERGNEQEPERLSGGQKFGIR